MKFDWPGGVQFDGKPNCRRYRDIVGEFPARGTEILEFPAGWCVLGGMPIPLRKRIAFIVCGGGGGKNKYPPRLARK